MNKDPDMYEREGHLGFKMICLNIGNLSLKFEDLKLDHVVKHPIFQFFDLNGVFSTYAMLALY